MPTVGTGKLKGLQDSTSISQATRQKIKTQCLSDKESDSSHSNSISSESNEAAPIDSSTNIVESLPSQPSQPTQPIQPRQSISQAIKDEQKPQQTQTDIHNDSTQSHQESDSKLEIENTSNNTITTTCTENTNNIEIKITSNDNSNDNDNDNSNSNIRDTNDENKNDNNNHNTDNNTGSNNIDININNLNLHSSMRSNININSNGNGKQNLGRGGRSSNRGRTRLPSNPTRLNENHSININVFEDYSPEKGRKYFNQNCYDCVRHGLCVVVPFFNETAYELETTLTSLYESHLYLCEKSPYLWKYKPFHVCIIQDGWQNIHISMKKYLQNMFPNNNENKWDDNIFGKKRRNRNTNVSNISNNSTPHSKLNSRHSSPSKSGNNNNTKPITVIFEKDATKNPMTFFTTKYHISAHQRSYNLMQIQKQTYSKLDQLQASRRTVSQSISQTVSSSAQTADPNSRLLDLNIHNSYPFANNHIHGDNNHRRPHDQSLATRDDASASVYSYHSNANSNYNNNYNHNYTQSHPNFINDNISNEQSTTATTVTSATTVTPDLESTDENRDREIIVMEAMTKCKKKCVKYGAYCMQITLIIKIDNRRKHNSHEWFLKESGFARAFKSEYFFCTDAYTIFAQNTLYELVSYLDSHPNCTGVTGRQRAMSRSMQRRKEIEPCISPEYLLRLTQTYEFELSGCVFNPTYDLIGFLPVLPGPCGLYRSKDVLGNKFSKDGNAIGWYFDIVNASPNENGLILGNLSIAEDRVLTYASVLKCENNYNPVLAYVPNALFYFEAETSMDRFVYQRRRWINGTFAGYVFLLLSQPWHLWNWQTNNCCRKIFVYFILFLNLIQQLALIISPVLSFIIFNFSVSYLLDVVSSGNRNTDNTTYSKNTFLFAIGLLWCIHVIGHHFHKFHKTIFLFLQILSVIMALTFFAAMGHIVGMSIFGDKNFQSSLKLEEMSDIMFYVLIGLTLFTLIAPFICSILVDLGTKDCQAFLLLIKAAIPFYLSFYLMIPWFSSYAFVRCWDLTWGNRPSTAILGRQKKKSTYTHNDKVIRKRIKHTPLPPPRLAAIESATEEKIQKQENSNVHNSQQQQQEQEHHDQRLLLHQSTSRTYIYNNNHDPKSTSQGQGIESPQFESLEDLSKQTMTPTQSSTKWSGNFIGNYNSNTRGGGTGGHGYGGTGGGNSSGGGFGYYQNQKQSLKNIRETRNSSVYNYYSSIDSNVSYFGYGTTDGYENDGRASQAEIAKHKFKLLSHCVVFFLVLVNVGVFFVDAYIIAWIMGIILLTTAIFMLISMFTLLCRYQIWHFFCNQCGKCWYKLCCDWKKTINQRSRNNSYISYNSNNYDYNNYGLSRAARLANIKANGGMNQVPIPGIDLSRNYSNRSNNNHNNNNYGSMYHSGGFSTISDIHSNEQSASGISRSETRNNEKSQIQNAEPSF